MSEPGVSVECDVQMPGADGPRQVDVVLRSSVGPIDLVTIVECKDYNKMVDVTRVDALHSVMQDVGASKGVLVARKGFSKTALHKAKRVGISLFRADSLDNLPGTVHDVPVYVREIRQAAVHVTGRIQFEENTTMGPDAIWHLNDLDLLTILREEILKDPARVDRPGGRHLWSADGLTPPYFLRDVQGRAWEFDELELSYELEERHFFGHLSDLESVLYLHDVAKAKSTVLLPMEALSFDYRTRFAQYDSAKALPLEPKLVANVALVPNPGDITTSGELRRIGPSHA